MTNNTIHLSHNMIILGAGRDKTRPKDSQVMVYISFGIQTG